jgi:2-polyprenyl-6-methoxyphenol hydroxylase-like FAD-dependent oxidoreductase
MNLEGCSLSIYNEYGVMPDSPLLSRHKFDVVVVGGGMGALSLAYALAQRGYNIGVIDARRGITPARRGLALLPNGLQALAKVGLLPLAEKGALKLRFMKYFLRSHELLVSYDFDRLPHPQNHVLMVQPHELEASIRERALDAGVKLFEGTVFEGLVRDDGLIGGIRAKAEDGGSDFGADVVVGADGSTSRVRKEAGIRAEVRQYSFNYMTTVLRDAPDLKDEARHHLSRGKMLAVFPVRGGTYVTYYSHGLGIDQEESAPNILRGDLKALEASLSGSLENLTSWKDLAQFRSQYVRVDTWLRDRLALMGDAAHTLEPSLGQGQNLAFEDSAVLADVLDESFRRQDFSAKALSKYQDLRKPYTDLLQRMAEYVSRYMNTNSRVIGWLRNRALRKAQTNDALNLLSLRIAAGMTRELSLSQKLRLGGFL